jgi:L-histidine N-alpha-methyltransferase
VHGLICDFEHHLERLPDSNGGCRLIAFLGGTIGNFTTEERREFLTRIAALMSPEDRLLLGTDLVKDSERLEAAYDDSAGVTAEFNKNVLRVLNRELDADFDPDRFEHVARYDADEERVDIRLRSLADQSVRLDGLDMDVSFAKGEEMRTELSCKFTEDSLKRAYADSGLEMAGFWTDPDRMFALSLARRTPSSR